MVFNIPNRNIEYLLEIADTSDVQQYSLKPQDIAVLLKLFSEKGEQRQIDLAHGLALSQGEIAKSLMRLSKAGLVNSKRPNRAAALEFLVHGVKYAFPLQLGALAFGVPAALSAPDFQNIVLNNNEQYVWPSIDGKMRGQAIEPLYPRLAEAALRDKKFYKMMSAVEILRMGRARERKLAEASLRKEMIS